MALVLSNPMRDDMGRVYFVAFATSYKSAFDILRGLKVQCHQCERLIQAPERAYPIGTIMHCVECLLENSDHIVTAPGCA